MFSSLDIVKAYKLQNSYNKWLTQYFLTLNVKVTSEDENIFLYVDVIS